MTDDHLYEEFEGELPGIQQSGGPGTTAVVEESKTGPISQPTGTKHSWDGGYVIFAEIKAAQKAQEEAEKAKEKKKETAADQPPQRKRESGVSMAPEKTQETSVKASTSSTLTKPAKEQRSIHVTQHLESLRLPTVRDENDNLKTESSTPLITPLLPPPMASKRKEKPPRGKGSCRFACCYIGMVIFLTTIIMCMAAVFVALGVLTGWFQRGINER